MKARFLLFALGTVSPALVALAGSRSSASYAVPADSTDAGGRRSTSAAYAHDGSLGGIAGVSSVVSPAETLKAGYIAQLYEITNLTLATVSGATVLNENTSVQLQARQLLDDATFLPVPAASVAWSVYRVPAGSTAPIPLSVSPSGLATAGPVTDDTFAGVRGDFGGRSGYLTLLVRNVDYADDGIDDAWQTQYFGAPPNPQAGPGQDPDGDGQTNLFEFVAGLVPTDASTTNLYARFVYTVAPVAGQPNQREITFRPAVAGRTYTVSTRTSLTTGTWQPLGTFTDDGGTPERKVVDLNAASPTGARFYRVEITRP